MAEDLSTRRRAPSWVRAFSDQALHGLAGKMHRQELYGDGLTASQEWLHAMVLNELEYRARRDVRAAIRPCSCMFCCGPFDVQQVVSEA